MIIQRAINLLPTLLLIAACAAQKPLPPSLPAAPPAGPAPVISSPQTTVEPGNVQSLSDAEQAFGLALDAAKEERWEAVTAFCANVQMRFPRTIWYKRSLFLAETALIRLDRPDEAAAAMLRVRAEYSELADYALQQFAEYAFSRNRFSEAAALYGALANSYPNSSLAARAEFRGAVSLLESFAYAPAIDAFTAFLDARPDSEFAPEAGLGLGRALVAEARLTEAVALYQDLRVDYAGTGADADAEKALAELAASGVIVPEPDSDRLYERGRNLSKPNSYDKAVEVFTKLLDKPLAPPRRADVMVRAGVALHNLGRRAEAATILEQMTRSYPSDARAHEALYWLGRSYGKMGDYERALKVYQKLLDRFPQSEWADDALFFTATIHREAGDMKKALRFYTRMGLEYPASKYADSAVWWRAWALYTAGEYRKTEQTLQELVNTYPRSFLVNQARYWQGRAAEKAGKPARALAYYERVLKAGPYTYYGYRAAERRDGLAASGTTAALTAAEGAEPCANGICADDLLTDFDLEEGPPVWTDETRRMLAAEPAFRKTLELMSLNMRREAARELWLLQGAKSRRRGTLIGLSKAFFELGDYGRSLQLVLRNYEPFLDRPRDGTPDDLWLLAYPQGHWESIQFYARKYGQDPYFVAAVIREESRFFTDALSPAGARGLMQVMPTTGEWVAKRIKLDGFERAKLFESDTAIHIGTWYLGHLMKQFKGDPLLAAAAYNAGPEAVAGWIARYGYNGERDVFVETIPFMETRGYVKKVLRNYYEYKRIYGRTGLVADRREDRAPPDRD